MNLKNKTILVWDYGLFTEIAAALIRDFKQVFYYVPWQDAFPSSSKQKIGIDFKGITRIQNFWEYVDKVDLIASFDTYCGDVVDYLRRKGYRTWGAGEAEAMELQRWQMRQEQALKGMATQATLRLKSVDDLETYLMGIKNQVEDQFGEKNGMVINKRLNHLWDKYKGFNEDYFVGGNIDELIKEFLIGAKKKFVKANMRGDIETFYVPSYDDSVSKLNSLFETLGHRGDAQETEFVIEENKEGIEPGFDGIQVNGQFLNPTAWGFERKGGGYIGKICNYEDLPDFMKSMNAQLSEILKEFSPTCSFFSTEFIVGSDKKPYLIDPTVRNPAPVGSAIFSELYRNLGEILYNGAEGKTTVPEMYPTKYIGGFSCDSEWADKHELEVEVAPEIDRWVKFRKAYQKDKKYYALPGFNSICSIIGFGNTVDEVIKVVDQRADKVKAYELQTTHNLNLIQEDIEKGRELGILTKEDF